MPHRRTSQGMLGDTGEYDRLFTQYTDILIGLRLHTPPIPVALELADLAGLLARWLDVEATYYRYEKARWRRIADEQSPPDEHPHRR